MRLRWPRRRALFVAHAWRRSRCHVRTRSRLRHVGHVSRRPLFAHGVGLWRRRYAWMRKLPQIAVRRLPRRPLGHRRLRDWFRRRHSLVRPRIIARRHRRRGRPDGGRAARLVHRLPQRLRWTRHTRRHAWTDRVNVPVRLCARWMRHTSRSFLGRHRGTAILRRPRITARWTFSRRARHCPWALCHRRCTIPLRSSHSCRCCGRPRGRRRRHLGHHRTAEHVRWRRSRALTRSGHALARWAHRHVVNHTGSIHCLRADRHVRIPRRPRPGEHRIRDGSYALRMLVHIVNRPYRMRIAVIVLRDVGDVRNVRVRYIDVLEVAAARAVPGNVRFAPAEREPAHASTDSER